MKVLFVDDEPDILEQGKIFLQRGDDRLEIVTTTSPREALNIVESGEVEAVISNYQMPEMDGLEFLSNVRDQDEDIPFIMFTGKGREEVAMKALNFGADRYFQKGDDPKTLYVMLTDAVVSEVEHRRAEKGYEDLFEGIADGIFVCGSDLNFLDVNIAASDQLGYSKKELLSMKAKDIIAEDQEDKLERIRHLIRKGNKKNKEVVFECDQLTKDGEKKPVEVNCSSIKYQGEPAALCVARDISKRKTTEETVRNATSAMVSQIGSDDLFQQIVDNAREISNAKFVVLSLYDKEKEIVKTKALSGAGLSLIDRVSDMFGVENLVGVEYPAEETPRFEKFSQRKEKEPLVLNGLHEYTFGMFGEQTCKLVEKLIGIEEILAVPLLNNDEELVGILGYLFPEEKKDRNYTPLMIFADFASQAIKKTENYERDR